MDDWLKWDGRIEKASDEKTSTSKNQKSRKQAIVKTSKSENGKENKNRSKNGSKAIDDEK